MKWCENFSASSSRSRTLAHSTQCTVHSNNQPDAVFHGLSSDILGCIFSSKLNEMSALFPTVIDCYERDKIGVFGEKNRQTSKENDKGLNLSGHEEEKTGYLNQ